MDMVFSLRLLQEKARENNRNLFVTFISLTKAFDTVFRDVVWLVLREPGVPEKRVNVIISSHHGVIASVTSSVKWDKTRLCSCVTLICFVFLRHIGNNVRRC